MSEIEQLGEWASEELVYGSRVKAGVIARVKSRMERRKEKWAYQELLRAITDSGMR
jgi:hypothetical protein